MSKDLPIIVEFTGGLEALFGNKRKHSISVPEHDSDDRPASIAFLIKWLCDNLMTDSRQEVFVLDGSVRPGILVLINDSDWELEGQDAYELQARDNVIFVSTLHGG